MDVVGDILASLRLTGGVILEGKASGDWCVYSQMEPDDVAELLRAQAVGERAGRGCVVGSGGGIEAAEQVGHEGKIGVATAGLNAVRSAEVDTCAHSKSSCQSSIKIYLRHIKTRI